MYEAINRRQVEAAVALIDDDCCYEDLNFSAAFLGRAAVEGLFEESCAAVSPQLSFVIDDITGDELAAGVVWHVELDGEPFPNSRGVSFYRLSPISGKIIYARDCVESALKPGRFAFTLIRWITPVWRYWQRLKSGGARLAGLLWAAAIVYVTLLLLSPPAWLPGEPAWAIRPETLRELGAESLNFFFILPLLNLIGVSYLTAPTVHPVDQGFFNAAEAWIFMFLPLLLLDPRGRGLPRLGLWGLAMFLTNVFLLPYMALRLGQPPGAAADKGWLARCWGAIGLAVGGVSIGWFGYADPAAGALGERLAYFVHQLSTSRVTLAFLVDVVLFGIFQAWLMGAVMAPSDRLRPLRFVPFLGLGLWLLV